MIKPRRQPDGERGFGTFRYLIGLLLFVALSSVPIIQLVRSGKDEQLNLIVIVAGFFVYLIVDRFEIFASIRRQESALDRITNLESEIRSLAILERHKYDNAIAVLSAESALQQIIGELKAANAVINVGCIDASVSASVGYATWLDAIETTLLENTVSFNEVIFSKDLTNRRIELMRKCSMLSKRAGDYYGYAVNDYKSDIPVLLYTIVFIKGEMPKVYFGWSSGTDYSLIHTVFLSMNKDVVTYFVSHYEALKRMAVPVTELKVAN